MTLVVENSGPIARLSAVSDREGVIDRHFVMAPELMEAALEARDAPSEGPGAVDLAAGVAFLADRGREAPVRAALALTDAALAAETARALRETGLPVQVLSPSACAVWGEGRFGAGMDAGDQLHLPLGSEVSGLLLGGRPFVGGGGGEAAPGHLCVDPSGPLCRCGARGCLLAYVDLAAIEAASRALAVTGDGPPRPGRDSGVLTDLVAREAGGCALSARVLDGATRALGIAAGGLLNALDPAMVVIHCPVPQVWPRLAERVHRAVAAHSFAAIREGVQWRLATLGDEAAVLGAADLAAWHCRAPSSAYGQASTSTS